MDFYPKTLKDLADRGVLDPAARTLVIAAGPYDYQSLLAAGFSNVTISNLESHGDASYPPYDWRHLDGENLDLEDNSYAQVIEHMGLHHCSSPHKALLEMYRVASRAVVVFENRDSVSLRFAVKLGLTMEFELPAVRQNDLTSGGMRNGPIPNFVYRWTEREVKKTVASADPAHDVPIEYFYNVRFPDGRVKRLKGLRRLAMEAVRLPYAMYSRVLPRQANVFGFCINKSARTPKVWMNDNATAINAEWAHTERLP
jgi:hypothetical protein